MMIDKKSVTADGLIKVGLAAFSLDIITYPLRWAVTFGKASSPSRRAVYYLGKYALK